ncbi:MAG: hypothetical protein ACE5LS_04955, partial [Thermoplasmata archaeon]
VGLQEKFLGRIEAAGSIPELEAVGEDLSRARGLGEEETDAIRDALSAAFDQAASLDQVIDDNPQVVQRLQEKAETHGASELSIVPPEERGTEARIQEVLGSRRLEAIMEASKDGLGEGVLYHDLGKEGLFPAADLVDMITADMGGIQENLLKVERLRLAEPDSKRSWDVYEATVEALDTRTGKRVVAQAAEVIDWNELEKGRSFAKRKAIRKAARNAKLGLIPVPRKALCTLVRRILTEYREGQEEALGRR